MSELRLDGLRDVVARRIRPFMEEVFEGYRDNIHSIYITGSALTDDFIPSGSDINSVFVLREMDLKFLEVLAPKGKKFRKQNVAAPLVMTPGYIKKSCDVFPIEFLNISLLHETVYGEDIFADIKIAMADLRRQCERELKVKLIGLRQGYLATMGDAREITEGMATSMRGYIPLFRGIISLKGMEPPVVQADVIKALSDATGVDCAVFEKVLRQKREKVKLSIDELNAIFEDYYAATERLGGIVDEIQA
jgi:predicted nucleotidyltransferase